MLVSGRVVDTDRTRMVRQDVSRIMNRVTYAVVEEIVCLAVGQRPMDEAVVWTRTEGSQPGVYSRKEDARAFYRRPGYGELVHTPHLDIS